MIFHNTERLIKPYNKTVMEITRDEIEELNEIKRGHNEKVDGKHGVGVNDIVVV